jgi:hypothetical protein|tara:strand:+ start:406 stop:534 length:129 start_codon:yes stop_codon:yes gene_type:complete
MIDKIIELKKEFGLLFTVAVVGMVGFSAIWWVKEICDFLIKH